MAKVQTKASSTQAQAKSDILQISIDKMPEFGPTTPKNLEDHIKLRFSAPILPIHIRRGRKQSLFLHTIDFLARLQISELGNPFQPCTEDLVFLYGGNRKRTDQAIKALKGKALLERVKISVLGELKYVPDILALSKEGFVHLEGLRENGIIGYEEWKQVQPRIMELLRAPQILFSDQTKVSFFHVREILRLIVPYLPLSSRLPLNTNFIATITAFNKTKRFSAAEVCQQTLGFIDALLRLQASYLSSETLREIAKILENHGLRVDLNKKKLYPHIQIGARLFGENRNSGRKDLYYGAVLNALNHYCEKFDIEEQKKNQIIEFSNQLRDLRRISLDPEARALGLMGLVIKGLFLAENRKRFPLLPEIWLAGRDQMHQIRRLLRNLGLEIKAQ